MIIMIAGATASGKTKLAVRVAKVLNGEIVSADSMQVYQMMNIGTAKATMSEQEEVPHYGLDIVPPSTAFSVAEYRDFAEKTILDIENRGKVAVFVGGTGLYLRSLIQPFEFGNTGKNEALRAELNADFEQYGAIFLHQKLANLAPDQATKIHPNNVKRVIRAIEIAVSELEQSPKQLPHPNFEALQTNVKKAAYFVIEQPREFLYQRINSRVINIINNGLQNEVSDLLNNGITFEHQSMQGIGYKEWAPFFLENASIQSVVCAIQQNSRNYAKRQITWFKKENGAIYLDGTKDIEVLVKEIVDYYKKCTNQE